jgi:hypothetical protein
VQVPETRHRELLNQIALRFHGHELKKTCSKPNPYSVPHAHRGLLFVLSIYRFKIY